MVFPETWDDHKKESVRSVTDILSGETDPLEGRAERKLETILADYTRSRELSSEMRGDRYSSYTVYNPTDFMVWWGWIKPEGVLDFKPSLLYKVFNIIKSLNGNKAEPDAPILPVLMIAKDLEAKTPLTPTLELPETHRSKKGGTGRPPFLYSVTLEKRLKNFMSMWG